MRAWTGRRAGRHYGARGFTLAELMVVVAIIGILIGVLIPAVSRVRDQARNMATRAVLGALETGLEMFKADGKIGGGYPPSISEHRLGFTYKAVRSPYGGLSSALPDPIVISGAGLLVWALAGADGLGTPGFNRFRDTGDYWWNDTDNINEGPDIASASGAYAMRSDGSRPLQTRYGPYVDLSRIAQSGWDVAEEGFVIESEKEAITDPSDFRFQRDYPMFLDGFGFPVLYWRADTAGLAMADAYRRGEVGQSHVRGFYHWEDNEDLIVDHGPATLVLRPGASDHKLDFAEVDTSDYGPLDNLPDSMSFARYVKNPGVQAKLMPYRPDSYLLVTPGADGLYGTGDDVANFDHNGR